MSRELRVVVGAVVRNELTGERLELDCLGRTIWTLPPLEPGERGELPDGSVLAELHGAYAEIRIKGGGRRRRLQRPLEDLASGTRCLVLAERLPRAADGTYPQRAWPAVVERLLELDEGRPLSESEEIRALELYLREADPTKH